MAMTLLTELSTLPGALAERHPIGCPLGPLLEPRGLAQRIVDAGIPARASSLEVLDDIRIKSQRQLRLHRL